MKVGLLCVVGRLVATQPPWSMATSMITLPGFISRRSSRSTRLGAFAPGIEHRADHQVGPPELLADRVPVAEERGDVRRHDVVEVAEAVHVDVQEADVRPKAGGDLGGVGPDDAAAEDRDVGRLDARHAGQQDAAAHLRPFEILGPFLDAHPPGDFAHGGQAAAAGRGRRGASRRRRRCSRCASTASVSWRSAAKWK